MSSSRVRRHVLLFLITLSLFVSAGASDLLVRSQAPAGNAEISTPPRVIDVYPDPNTELTGMDPVTVSFDQPMDQSSVAQALRLDPLVAGAWHWDDPQTVTFVPDSPWPQDKTYRVVIDARASTPQHQPMAAPYSVSVRTQGPLKVVQHDLRYGEARPSNSLENVHIDIGFNRPMVSMGSYDSLEKVPAPITVSPETPAQGMWMTPAQYRITFTAPLIHSSTYTLNTVHGLQAVDGAFLPETFTWSFTTPDPWVSLEAYNTVESYNVNDKPPRLTNPDAPIRVAFGQAMDQASVEQAFRVVGPDGVVNGKLVMESSSHLTFSPPAMWQRSGQYTITVSTAALTLNGKKPLKQELKLVFRVIDPPRIRASIPPDGQYYDGSVITLLSNLPLRKNQDFAAFITITDESGHVVPIDDARRISLDHDRTLPDSPTNFANVLGIPILKPVGHSSDYTVSLKPGLVDRWGMPVPPYTFTFTDRPERRPSPTPMPTATLGLPPTITPTPVPLTRASFPLEMGLAPVLKDDVAITSAASPKTLLPVRFEHDRPVIMTLYRLEARQFNKTLLLSSQYQCFDYYRGDSCHRFMNEGDASTWEKQREPYRGRLPEGITAAQRVRQWTVAGDDVSPDVADPEYGLHYLPVTSADGKKLTPGLYWITMQDPDFDPMGYQFPLVVASANLTIKRGPNDALVWVTDLQTAQPVASTTVTLSLENGQPVISGQTDAGGVFHPALDPARVPADAKLLAVAQSPGQFGLWYNANTYAERREQYYVYTDRQIYRPGEKVRLRGLIRVPSDMTYQLPDNLANRTINVCIRSRTDWDRYSESVYSDRLARSFYPPLDNNSDEPSEVIYLDDLAVSAWGSFAGEFTLPQSLKASDFYVQVDCKTRPDQRPDIEPGSTQLSSYDHYDDYYYVSDSTRRIWNYRPALTSFRVTSYRVPEFTVKLTQVPTEVLPGQEPYHATIEANYYAGTPLNGAKVDWQILAAPTVFHYTGSESYNFNDCSYNSYSPSYSPRDGGNGETDKQGRLQISSSLESLKFCPHLVYTQANVTDLSNQVSGAASATTLVYPTRLYIGVSPRYYAPIAGKPMVVDLIGVTPDSRPVAGQKLTVILREQQFSSPDMLRAESVEISSTDVVTGADGRYAYTFVPRLGTLYTVEVTDNRETPTAKSTASMYVRPAYQGGDPVWARSFHCWGGSFDLRADKEHYKPGDAAQILIALPGTGRKSVLITAERAGILSYEVIRTTEPSVVYKLPITGAFAPNVLVSAMMLSEIDPASNLATQRAASVELLVDLQDQLLNVELMADRQQYRPGDEAQFTVRVTDHDNKPVEAEVGLKLVDQAVLDLAPDTQLSLQAAFYKEQLPRVTTALSLFAIIDPSKPGRGYQPDGCGGGGGGGDTSLFDLAVPLRKDYETTPLWAPQVVTGKDGVAVVKVRLPANLTAWQLDARAITRTAQIGQQQLHIITNLPLSVRPVVPRFFVAGDKAQLAAVVTNATDKAQTVTVTLQAFGLEVSDPLTRVVEIAANQRTRIAWNATVLEPAPDGRGADITFTARGTGGFQDAAKPPLTTGPGGTVPIRVYLAPEKIGRAGTLVGQAGRVEAIRLPKRMVAGLGTLSVGFDYSLAGATTRSLQYLRQYPYYCTEQTVSTFLPNAVTLNAVKKLGLANPDLEASLRTAMAAAQEKLKESQRENGSWGWYHGMEDNPIVTAYVALGLLEAQAAEMTIDQDSLQRGLAFIAEDAQQVLAEHIPASNYDPELNHAAFSYYVLSKVNRAPIYALDRLLSQRDKLTMAAQAFLLMAYHQQFPDNPAVRLLVNELIASATPDAEGRFWPEAYVDYLNWGTDIRTTAVVVLALSQIDVHIPVLTDAVRWLIAARIGDHWPTTQETVWSVLGLTQWMTVTGELKPDFSYTLSINGKTVGNATVTPESLWKGQRLQWSVTELLRDQVNRLAVTRSDGSGVLYYHMRLDVQLSAESVLPLYRGLYVSRRFVRPSYPNLPINDATVGETIVAEMTVVVPETVYFVAIEDAFPAGLEPIDVDDSTAPSVWGRQVDELRDDRAIVYADMLTPGVHTFQYLLRATTPGDFRVLPIQGYSFYVPGIFGRGSGSVFRVEDDSG